MERKITAILAVDVAGFSKMMEEDEERTLDLLKNRREIKVLDMTLFFLYLI